MTGPGASPGPVGPPAAPPPGAWTSGAGTSGGTDFTTPEPVRVSPRSRTLSYGALATAVLLAVMAFLPAPFVIHSPGPTVDTLGEVDGKPVVQITGAQTHATTGELRLLTVLESGGPGFSTTLQRVLAGWWDRDVTVLPRDEVYPPSATREQEQEASAAQMVSSQQSAQVAALTELGYDVPVTLTVSGTVAGSGAAGVLQKDDVITSLDGTKVTTYPAFLDELHAVTPGDDITLGITRDGKAQQVTVTTGKSSDGKASIGVYLSPQFDMPVDITINLGADIGGPSAGTMFALAIIDKLSTGDLTGGKVVAGTGTIDVDGTVGAIGGIRQKLAGARRDGATWFLAPRSNCDEVVGYVPSGLHVVSMTTLHQARQELEAIASGDTADLPTCRSS